MHRKYGVIVGYCVLCLILRFIETRSVAQEPGTNRHLRRNAAFLSTQPSDQAMLDDLLRKLESTPTARSIGKSRVRKDQEGNVVFVDLSELAVTSQMISLLSQLDFLSELSIESPLTLGDLRPLARLPGLRRLSLTQQVMKPDSLAWLDRASKIEALFLQHVQGVGPNLRYVSRLKLLQHLSLSGSDVVNTDLLALSTNPELWILSLQNTLIDDGGVAIISGIPKLRVVELNSSRLSEKGVARLKSIRPDIICHE